MRQHAAWVWFDGHARIDNAPCLAKTLRSFFRADTSPLHGVEAPWPVQSIGIGGEAAGGEKSRGDAVFRGTTDVQGLRHGAEVAADAGGKTRGDAKPAAQVVAV